MSPAGGGRGRDHAAGADLGEYFAHKLRGATALAVFEATGTIDWLVAARAETSTADDAWAELADDTSYFVPFTDDYKTYPVSQCSAQVPFLAEDGKSLDAAASAVGQPPAFSGTLPVPTTWLYAPRPSHPNADLAIAPQDPRASQWTATVRVPGAPAGTTVTVLWKPFASTKNWTSVAATFAGTTFTALIAPTGNSGALLAAEIVEPGGTCWRVPDPRVTMPYVSLAP